MTRDINLPLIATRTTTIESFFDEGKKGSHMQIEIQLETDLVSPKYNYMHTYAHVPRSSLLIILLRCIYMIVRGMLFKVLHDRF